MTQLLCRLAKSQIRPTIIERFSNPEEIESLNLEVAMEGDSIVEVAYMGTPLGSCHSYEEKKWLIQIYIRTEHFEFTGYPEGLEEFIYPWTRRHTLQYRVNKKLQPFVKPKEETPALGVVLDLSSYEGDLSQHQDLVGLPSNMLVACLNIRKDKVTVNNQLIGDNGNLLLMHAGDLNFTTFKLFML